MNHMMQNGNNFCQGKAFLFYPKYLCFEIRLHTSKSIVDIAQIISMFVCFHKPS